MNPHSLLIALLAFQAKHFLCDFVLQSKWQIEAKKTYGDAGGIVHAGLHSLFTVPVLLILTKAPAYLIAIPVAEFVIHYHLDWAKMRIDMATGWTQADQPYWVVFGLDQFLHQTTYLAIIALFALAT